MALSRDEFHNTLKALVQEYEKGEIPQEDLRLFIEEEAIELVESLNSRDVARPEYSHGGDR